MKNEMGRTLLGGCTQSSLYAILPRYIALTVSEQPVLAQLFKAREEKELRLFRPGSKPYSGKRDRVKTDAAKKGIGRQNVVEG